MTIQSASVIDKIFLSESLTELHESNLYNVLECLTPFALSLKGKTQCGTSNTEYGSDVIETCFSKFFLFLKYSSFFLCFCEVIFFPERSVKFGDIKITSDLVESTLHALCYTVTQGICAKSK